MRASKLPGSAALAPLAGRNSQQRVQLAGLDLLLRPLEVRWLDQNELVVVLQVQAEFGMGRRPARNGSRGRRILRFAP